MQRVDGSEADFGLFCCHIPTTKQEIEQLVARLYDKIRATNELCSKIHQRSSITSRPRLEIRELYETDPDEDDDDIPTELEGPPLEDRERLALKTYILKAADTSRLLACSSFADLDRVILGKQALAAKIDASFKEIKSKIRRKKIRSELSRVESRLETAIVTAEWRISGSFRAWESSDVIEWLQYSLYVVHGLDIVLGDSVRERMQCVSGRRMVDINDLFLEAVGISDPRTRKCILDMIDDLLIEFGDRSSCAACNLPTYPHAADCDRRCRGEQKESEKEKESEKHLCCICAMNTIIL